MLVLEFGFVKRSWKEMYKSWICVAEIVYSLEFLEMWPVFFLLWNQNISEERVAFGNFGNLQTAQM